MTVLVWTGLDEPRMEIARAELRGGDLRASGTQIGIAYELRYELDGGVLDLEVVGERSARVVPGDADFVDLGFSPLTNSLPILRDDLRRADESRDYVMALVHVPSLEVTESRQRYEPAGDARVVFRSGDFSATLELDGPFVAFYPELARLVFPPRPASA